MPTNLPPERQGYTKLDNNMFPGHDKACRIILIALSTHDDSYVPTHRQLAQQTGYSMRTVRSTIKKLEDLGEIYRGPGGRNRTQKWFLNNSPVRKPLPNKLGNHCLTKKTIKKVLANPKTKSKKRDPMPACTSGPQAAPDEPVSHKVSKADVVFMAQAIEEYFFTFVNYRRLNDWVLKISERYGPKAYLDVIRFFEEGRRIYGDPNKQWVFSYRNLQILEKETNFNPGSHLKIVN